MRVIFLKMLQNEICMVRDHHAHEEERADRIMRSDQNENSNEAWQKDFQRMRAGREEAQRGDNMDRIEVLLI